MRVDRETLLDIIGKLKNTEDSIRSCKEETERMRAFHRTLKLLYRCNTDRSGYDKTVSVLRKSNFKLHSDYVELLDYRKKLKAKRYYVAKKLAAMKSSKVSNSQGET